MDIFVLFLCLLLSHGFAKAQDDEEMEKLLAEEAKTKTDEQPEPGKEAPQTKPDEKDGKKDDDDEEMEKMLAEEAKTKKDEQPEPGKEAPQTKPDEKEEKKDDDDEEMEKMLAEEAKTKKDKDVEQAKAPEADKSQGASGVQSPVVDDLTTSEVSNSVRQCIINDLPEELKVKIQETDDAEEKVLTSYSKTQSVQKDVLDGYNAAKKEERTTLKKILPDMRSEAARILVAYKAVRQGEVWNNVKHDDRFVEFFKQPSTALTEYQSLKADEVKSLESFLSSPSQDKAVSVNKRSLTAEAYEKAGVKTMERVQREEDVLERRLTAVGDIEGESNEAAEREKGSIDTTRKTIGLLQDPLDETSAEEVTTKIANVQIIHDNSSLVKFSIFSSLVGALTVAFIIMSAWRKQATQWHRGNKRGHRDLRQDMEPSSSADSQVYAHGTERLKSAQSSIPVTTVHDTPRL